MSTCLLTPRAIRRRVISAPPNTRVQRARSSPSAPRSPLTRGPLGDLRRRLGVFAIGCVIGAIFSSACVIRSGHNYWAWNDPGFSSEARCSLIPEGGVVRLRVVVHDPTGSPVPDATVRASQRSGKQIEAFNTDDQGAVSIPVESGRCHVDVECLGFKPAHYDLDIPPGRQCDITFGLDLAGSDVLTVA